MHHEFYHLAKKFVEQYKQKQFALATVVRVQGSAYRREGTRMVIQKNGNWFGNISGGCLEGDIRNKAINSIKNNENILVTYDTRESKNKEIRVALGCNGIIDILIEPVNETIVTFSKSVIAIFENQQTAFLSTNVEWINEKVTVSRKLKKQQTKEFPQKTPVNENFCQVEKTATRITLNEFIGLQRKVVIWGSGPDVVPLVNFAHQLGWQIEVANDCGLENIREKLPGINVNQTNFDDFIEKTQLHLNTAVLLVSHDYYKDYFILEKIINHPVKYIGIMGPKRRGARMVEELNKRKPGIQYDETKLHYPIGLDIGSDNPTEIALSIIAEIQACFSGKNATPLSQKTTRIHDAVSEAPMEEYNPDSSTCLLNNF
ncbi:XdhC family protein [uncultured Draconibacterium sp.]|uniref:XdhC family protein n=1 Tax=uncultured Draconibacterium sp. TaxID=1573823 RepID=UPI0025E64AEC|nr:XdhC family protein [uncultured Draconibacterium sp.]